VTILQEEGVLASAFSTTRLRLVTHLNLTDLQIDKTVETIKRRFK
jgi:threonine aldolase